MPGPVGKRADERHGHRTQAEQNRTDTSQQGSGPVTWPRADPEWCKIAKDWYAAIRKSGQAAYFEPTDVEAARLTAYAMTRVVNSEKFSPTAFGEVWSAMGDLLTTEGSRRRVKVELQKAEKPQGPSAAVANLSARRAQMEAKPTGTDS